MAAGQPHWWQSVLALNGGASPCSRTVAGSVMLAGQQGSRTNTAAARASGTLRSVGGTWAGKPLFVVRLFCSFFHQAFHLVQQNLLVSFDFGPEAVGQTNCWNGLNDEEIGIVLRRTFGIASIQKKKSRGKNGKELARRVSAFEPMVSNSSIVVAIRARFRATSIVPFRAHL